jgi:hypothetical protein
VNAALDLVRERMNQDAEIQRLKIELEIAHLKAKHAAEQRLRSFELLIATVKREVAKGNRVEFVFPRQDFLVNSVTFDDQIFALGDDMAAAKMRLAAAGATIRHQHTDGTVDYA